MLWDWVETWLLGSLYASVFKERLEKEYGSEDHFDGSHRAL